MAADLAKHIVALATHFWGDPNKKLSSKTELRWGKNGSKSVVIAKGAWYDNEQAKGGGVLDLIEREENLKGQAALRWMQENGFDVEFEERGSKPKAQAQERHDHDPRDDDMPSDPRDDYAPVSNTGLPPGVPSNAKLAKTYQYHDEAGELVIEVCRYEFKDKGKDAKTFRQRRPDGDRWVYSTRGIRQVPYNLAELKEAIAAKLPIFFVEGEKSVEKLKALGVPATTNAMGAGKWFDELTEHFRGADVIIIPDNDPQSVTIDGKPKFHEDGSPVFVGKDHMNLVASKIEGVAQRVRTLELPGLGDKDDVVEWIENGGTAEALYDLAETRSVVWSRHANFRSKFNAIQWSRLDEPGPELEWLIKGMLARKGISMVVGESRAGKTFYVVDEALSIARGEDFRGHKTLKGGVIYQAGEGALGVRKRLKAYRMFHGIKTTDDVPFVFLPEPIDLHGGEDNTDKFIEECLHWSSTFSVPLEMVIIDTFAAATPGANENASEDVGPILARGKKIAKALNTHVQFVHHLNAAGNKARGHTSIFANLDSVITLRRTDGLTDVDGFAIREAEYSKIKDSETEGDKDRFVLRRVVLGKDAEGEDITSCAVTDPNDGRLSGVDLKEEKGLKLTPQCSAFLRAIYRALDTSGHEAPKSFNLPPSVRVVRGDSVKHAFAGMTFEADGAKDATAKDALIRKAMQRHGAFLVDRGIIQRESPYLWLTGKPVKGFPRVNTGLNLKPAPADEKADQDGNPLEPTGFTDDIPF